MKDQNLGTAKTCEFGDYLVLGFSKKWMKFSNGKPLEFHTRINDGKLVLEAVVNK
jgi:hypothetical protein